MREQRTICGSDGDPYLTRTTLFRLGKFAVFLHDIHREDEDFELHDHPWSFVSIVLRGFYREEVGPNRRFNYRCRGNITFRQAEVPHRIKMVSKDCRTLVIHGPRFREWGFYTYQGWRQWETFLTNKYRKIRSKQDNVCRDRS